MFVLHGLARAFGGMSVVRCDAMQEEVSLGLEASKKAKEATAPGADGGAAVEAKPALVEQADREAQGRSAIRPPAQFTDLFGDTKRIVNVDTWDGLRVELQKPVTPSFFMSHFLWLGTSQTKTGDSYSLTAHIQEDDSLVMAKFDKEHNFDGRLHFPLPVPGLPVVSTKLQLSLQDEANNGMATFDVVQPTSSSQLVVGKGPFVSMAFAQAFSPRFILGGDCTYNEEQSFFGFSMGARYKKPEYLASLLYANGMLQAQYHRKIFPKRVTMAAELLTNPFAPEQSMVQVGAEFQLKQSRFQCAVDGNGKVDGALELTLNPMSVLQLTGQINHAENKHRFGFGFTLQVT